MNSGGSFFGSLFHNGGESYSPASAVGTAESTVDTSVGGDSRGIVLERVKSIITPFTRTPEKGSIIDKMIAYRNGNGDVKEQVEHYASKTLLPQVIAVLLADENDFMSYFTSRMVMSHPSSMDFSETFHREVISGGYRDQQFSMLGECFGTKIEKKSEVPKIFKKLVAYHPQVGPLLLEALGGAGLMG